MARKRGLEIKGVSHEGKTKRRKAAYKGKSKSKRSHKK